MTRGGLVEEICQGFLEKDPRFLRDVLEMSPIRKSRPMHSYDYTPLMPRSYRDVREVVSNVAA